MNRRTFLTSWPLLACCRSRAGEGYRGAAWVASGEEPTLAEVDLMAFAVRRRIDIHGRANRLLVRTDSGSRLLYSCDYADGWIEEIDPVAGRRVRALRLDGPLAGVRLLPGGGSLWAAADHPPRLVSIDTATLRPGRPVLLPASPVRMDLSPSGSQAAATTIGGEIIVADTAAGRISGLAAIGSQLGSVRFRSDGRLLSAADLGRKMICMVEPGKARVAVELPLALRPDRMWMKRDGGQLFISGEGRDAIAIVYPYRTEVAQTFLSGRKPGEMADSQAPAYLFVSNPEANSLTIFDINTQKVVAVTQVGLGPGPIAITPDQSYALVLNQISGDMAVLRTAAIAPGREKRVPLFTMIPVTARPAHAVVLPS